MSITKPAPATPPQSPTITAQRRGAEIRQRSKAIHAITEPANRLTHPQGAPASTIPCRTIRRIQAAPPRQARKNATAVPNLLPTDNTFHELTDGNIHRRETKVPPRLARRFHKTFTPN